MKQIMRAIGLMSGTSMDGIDLALIETDGEAYVKVLASSALEFEKEFADQIRTALDDAKSIVSREDRPGCLDDVERALTAWHIYAVAGFGLDADVIGFHGQTVLHRPNLALTVQLGDGEALAQQTGIDVVYDMRANDMVHGGQGAPLVPVYHQAIAGQLDAKMQAGGVAFVNIGGISNATFVFENQYPIAFDCGPGNVLIDQWMVQQAGVAFDAEGSAAAGGKPDEAIIARYLSSPFFSKTGPKSLDRNDFALDGLDGLDVADGAATLSKLTASAIVASAKQQIQMPETFIIAGGGARNKEIMRYIREGVGNHAQVMSADQAGFDADMMEAEAWAYLAVRSLKGLPLTFPSTTGCREPVTGGVLAKSIEAS